MVTDSYRASMSTPQAGDSAEGVIPMSALFLTRACCLSPEYTPFGLVSVANVAGVSERFLNQGMVNYGRHIKVELTRRSESKHPPPLHQFMLHPSSWLFFPAIVCNDLLGSV